ncbi:16S rRNA methyltransferase [Thiomicrospira aerophila AL3]|uniref:Ribosomal RNA small subunit methyltransferase E n=1 Tax=Thiomicrospira aerophila AL3 TaxID=717772 RepID=W0DX04_9GAMM|nr:16S rRNA (uracil(1498)-N(3))-methyltransferase [Thiomicrospira aerophila]AHF01783.1 16S rRNA methyltransferase [Thiomicrospira aerophila AL3]
MRIPRFYLAANYQPGLVIELDKDQAHYALTVLRLKNGHQIQVFDGQGQQADARLQVMGRRDAQVVLGDSISRPACESPLNTLLVQGISRGERMDYSLQKAVELGVSAIQPVFTERCEVRLDEDKAEKRRQQWQALVISACEQSGRCVVPEVKPLITLEHWFAQNPNQPYPKGTRGLVLDPYSTKTFNEIEKPNLTQSLALLIGPEGGLTEQEVEQAQAQGLQGIRLGPRILRTETAAPVILSLLQARWGDFF